MELGKKSSSYRWQGVGSSARRTCIVTPCRELAALTASCVHPFHEEIFQMATDDDEIVVI